MRQRKRLSFFEKCNEVFLKMDLFANPEFLKYKGEGAYQTYGGSILSVIIVAAFFITFFSLIKSTVNREKITSVSKLRPSLDSAFQTNESNSAFIFAVGIQGLILSQPERYFDIYMSTKVFKNSQPFSSVDVPLVPCSVDQWSGFNEQIQNTYTRLNFDAWLCPPKDFNFTFKGKYSSKEYTYTKIVVKKCNESNGGRCANTTAFNTFLFKQKTFKLNIYFANPIIDPSEKNYLDYVLEDTSYFQFTDMVGVSSHIFFSEYEVNTDKSILPEPMTDTTTEKGITLNERPIISNFEIINTDEFARIFLRKSDLILQYDRTYTRIDATLAYLGGLFGMVLIVFYGMKAFSEYAFEFQIGGQIFVYNDRSEFQTKKFHLIRFPLYLLYCIVTFFYPKADEWKCFQFERKVDECREEVKEQTDVCFLIKRVIYIEKAIEMFFGNKLERLSIDHRWTIDQAEQKRKFYDDHEKIKDMIVMSENTVTNKKRRDEASVMSIPHNLPNEFFDNQERLQVEIEERPRDLIRFNEGLLYDEIRANDIRVNIQQEQPRGTENHKVKLGAEMESKDQLALQEQKSNSSRSSKKGRGYKQISKGSSSESSGERKEEEGKENERESVLVKNFNVGKKRKGLKVTK